MIQITLFLEIEIKKQKSGGNSSDKMIDVGFIGDLHLGHEAIAKLRGFDDLDEYHEYVIKQYNSVLHTRSLVYLLGDTTFEKPKYYYLLDKLIGRKISINGNHDLPRDIQELLKYVESAGGAINYKGYLLSHIPAHKQEMSRFKMNIHAHLHEDTIKLLTYTPLEVKVAITEDPKYFCASWDRLNGIPISLEQILATKQ